MSETETARPHSAIFSPKQSAAYLDLSVPTIYKLMNLREIDSFTVGASRKITRESCDAFIQRKVTEAKKATRFF